MSHTTYLDYIRQFFSSPQEFENFRTSINQALPRTLSLVQSRNSGEQTIQELAQQGFHAVVSDYNTSNYSILQDTSWEQTIPLGKTKEHLLGYFYIQETAASLPASVIEIPMTGNILDMCAAPWGKTIQLADRCKISWSQALVRANDPDSKRLVSLWANLTRTGMENVVTTQRDGTQIGNILPEQFDAILLDAPCSGEGTGFKSDFGTKFRDIKKVEKIAKVQQQLLISAVKACKTGGQIIYSTCTTNPIENEMNVAWIMDKYPWVLELEKIEISWLSSGLTIDHPQSNHIQQHTKRLWPHTQGTGWFFLCILRKKQALPKWLPIQLKGSSKFSLCNQQQVQDWLAQQFGISVPKNIVFVQSKHQIYATRDQIIPYISSYQWDRPWLPVIKWEKISDWRLLHGAGLVFQFPQDHYLELDEQQIRAHIDQQAIPTDAPQKGYVQLLRKGKPAGVGKVVDGYIKNKFTWVL